jgi:hypothetical protein
MPITFAQPGVVNAGVDQTIGTGQADEAMVGTVASAYENAARLRAQSMMQGTCPVKRRLPSSVSM